MSNQTKKPVKTPRANPRAQTRGAAYERGRSMTRQRMPGTAMRRYHGS